MKTALVIMAAGLGSRYGGVKQLEPVGPSGEIIMDYSIYDAIEAGFDKVVFIIRKDLEQDFKEVIGNRISQLVEVAYVFQELDDLPVGFLKPDHRTKPWGTGQAILCCKDVVEEPFVVINADDYYGKEAFVKVHKFLTLPTSGTDSYNFCMAGFVLGNTLSEHGTVTRGVCKVNEDGILADIVETKDIERKGEQAVAVDSCGNGITLDLYSSVSMNMWGFTTDIFSELNKKFVDFLNHLEKNESKAEYLLPQVVDELIKENKAKVTVLKTEDKWFGVTYKEDKEMVVSCFLDLVRRGIYPEKLFV